MLPVALPGSDEVEHVRVFERLLGEFALRRGQGAREVGHLASELLALVELQIDLMVKDYTRPAIFDSRVQVPQSLFLGLSLVEEQHHVTPWNCAATAAQFRIHLTSELCHVLETTDRESPDAGECGPNVLRQSFDVFVAPLLTRHKLVAYEPVHANHLCRSLLRRIRPRGRDDLDHTTERLFVFIRIQQHGNSSSL